MCCWLHPMKYTLAILLSLVASSVALNACVLRGCSLVGTGLPAGEYLDVVTVTSKVNGESPRGCHDVSVYTNYRVQDEFEDDRAALESLAAGPIQGVHLDVDSSSFKCEYLSMDWGSVVYINYFQDLFGAHAHLTLSVVVEPLPLWGLHRVAHGAARLQGSVCPVVG